MMTPEVRTAIGLMCQAKDFSGTENQDLFQNCGCPDLKAVFSLEDWSIVEGWKCAICDKAITRSDWVWYVRGTQSGKIVPIEGYCETHFIFVSHYLKGIDLLSPEMEETRERLEKSFEEMHAKTEENMRKLDSGMSLEEVFPEMKDRSANDDCD